jgi:hypothetical protein
VEDVVESFDVLVKTIDDAFGFVDEVRVLLAVDCGASGGVVDVAAADTVAFRASGVSVWDEAADPSMPRFELFGEMFEVAPRVAQLEGCSTSSHLFSLS